MLWLRVSVGVLLVCSGGVAALAQTAIAVPAFSFATPTVQETSLVDSLEFIGLRHISRAAVAAQLSLHRGDRFDATKLRNDLRTLGRLGWFSSIRVEELSRTARNSQIPKPQEGLTLVFYLSEEPVLSSVEYSGSRLLSKSRIEKLLEEKKLTPGLGKPADPAALHQVAVEIRTVLEESGHPQAAVQVRQEVNEHATVNVRFEIADGPHLPVRRIRFEGNPGISEKLLRAQMQNIAPWKPLASLRSKNAYTQSAFEEDRRRMLNYFQNHGYPEARVGNARVEKITAHARKWVPFPHPALEPGLLLTIPVDGGPFYRFETIDATHTLEQAMETHRGKPRALPVTEQGRAFSQQDVDRLCRVYTARLRSGDSKSDAPSFQTVEARATFDPDSHSVRLKLNLSDSPPYLVHRLEFRGLHKFNDRFVRRRIPLAEGHPLDEHALEIGLTRLARTGYFKPILKEDIHIQLDDSRHTADVTIRLQEIGQQRITFEGGRAQFGSTLGIAYTLFDLLNREELLTTKLDGGPESLQLLLGIAKEGIFGTRASLAFSIFDNVIRPRFTHGVQGPFTTSHSEGVNVPWTYQLTNSDSVGVSYSLTRTVSDQSFGTTSSTPTVEPIDLRTHTSSSSLGTAWEHDTGNEHVLFSNSASGSFLGGEENMLRSGGEAARIFRDPVFSPANAWAFRTTFSAAGSYRGNAPLYSRFFAGDQFVRGLRDGELGPVAMTARTAPSGLIVPSPSYAGTNLITAANGEYRIPLRNGVEAAGFFDLGSGWLLPNWLGPTKPTLLSATNGILHGSTGVQFQWTIPGVQVPFRSYYALNVLRLDRLIPLSDKSFLHLHNRHGAFGWGLGSLF
ncbi:MAG TPA: POTRA domain-containing protein [Candidatus Acidoferrum sp.]|nr:POTRA domain-containing protein [Candidatus Acidoferrum sp.]